MVYSLLLIIILPLIMQGLTQVLSYSDVDEEFYKKLDIRARKYLKELLNIDIDRCNLSKIEPSYVNVYGYSLFNLEYVDTATKASFEIFVAINSIGKIVEIGIRGYIPPYLITKKYNVSATVVLKDDKVVFTNEEIINVMTDRVKSIIEKTNLTSKIPGREVEKLLHKFTSHGVKLIPGTSIGETAFSEEKALVAMRVYVEDDGRINTIILFINQIIKFNTTPPLNSSINRLMIFFRKVPSSGELYLASIKWNNYRVRIVNEFNHVDVDKVREIARNAAEKWIKSRNYPPDSIIGVKISGVSLYDEEYIHEEEVVECKAGIRVIVYIRVSSNYIRGFNVVVDPINYNIVQTSLQEGVQWLDTPVTTSTSSIVSPNEPSSLFNNVNILLGLLSVVILTTLAVLFIRRAK